MLILRATVGTIQADARSRQVIVTALPERMEEVAVLIESLDKKTQEVLIEARILRVILNPKFDIGIDWETMFGRLNLNSAFTPSTDDISSTLGSIAYGSLEGDNSMVIELKALQQVSDIKILANPRITVIDGEEANIHIGDKLAYTTATTTTGTSTSSTAESVTFVDVGIKLNVKPTINDNGYVTIAIKPEISSKTGEFESQATGNVFPLINTTIAETTVMIKDGTTIVIGGLRKDDRTRTVDGIPGLMNIPFLGALFRRESDEITKTEIVIFLTPHIISGDEDILEEDELIKPSKELQENVYGYMLDLFEDRELSPGKKQ